MATGGFRRPCLVCGTLARASYCDQHKPKIKRPEPTPQRKARKAHLYGGNYKEKAKRLRGVGGVCHLCGQTVPPGTGEADHANPELGHRSPLLITHRQCNQQRGNTPLQ